jgi:hypothetical protein
MKKKFSSVIVFTYLFIFLSQTAFGTSGYFGVNSYSSWNGSCPHGDRAGRTYVDNIHSVLRNDFSRQYRHVDSNANELNFRNASTVTFFAFSGHGVNQSTRNGAHFFARSTGHSWHDHNHCNYGSVNAWTTQVSFSHSYVTMYTCNWLTNSGSSIKLQNIYNTFYGTRLQMGFASVMYLDSREGTDYATRIRNGSRYRDAFVHAAQRWQTQRTHGSSIARVMGYTPARNDSINSSIHGPIPSYSSSPSSFSTIVSVTIPHNGQPIP